MSSAQESKMLTGPIGAEFIRFVVPSVIGMIALSSASVIDGIFIGNFVGATALASVNLVMPLLAFVFGVLIMVSLGGAVVAGKLLGEEQPQAASNMFSKTGLALLVLMGVLALITLAAPNAVVALLGARGETVPLSAQYAWVMAWFFPAFASAVLFGQFARVDGKPGIALMGMISTTLANIGLDALFIAWLGWGLTGAALATGLAFGVGTLIPLAHFLGPQAKMRLIRPFGSWTVLFRSSFNGFSEFLNESSSGVVLLLFNWILITQVGAAGVASFAVVDYLVYFGILIFYGVSEGIVPLISVNFGGRKPQRIRRILLLSLGFNFALGGLLMALFLIWPQHLIGIFLEGEQPDILNLSLSIIAIVWPIFFFIGANIAISGYFTGIQRPVQSSLIALFRGLILPVALAFVFWSGFGVMGTFYALPVSEALTFLLCLVLLRFTPPQPGLERPSAAQTK